MGKKLKRTGPRRKGDTVKKVRTLDDLYKGDAKHDDAPAIEDWETEFELEKKKLERLKRKEDNRIRFQKQKKQKNSPNGSLNDKNTSQVGLKDLKIQPNETLRQFNDRVNTESRIIQSERAIQERNTRRREKREEKVAIHSDDDEAEWKAAAAPKYNGDETPLPKRALPRFLDIADRPPELESIHNNKKRFKEFAPSVGSGKEQQMKAMVERVQGLYGKKKKS
jgi:hypothetical protein